jgi:hypothetical protein
MDVGTGVTLLLGLGASASALAWWGFWRLTRPLPPVGPTPPGEPPAGHDYWQGSEDDASGFFLDD